MKYLIGTKEHMTQYFTEQGKVLPVTILSMGPVTVTQVKTADTDGYSAIQFGFGKQKESRVAKAQLGHTKNLGAFKVLREHRATELPTVSVGDTLSVEQFAKGDMVNVSGITKAKGFQGVVKRYGFAGGPRTHGQKHSEREPGSIGGGLRNRVPKGMRMAGRTGGDNITVRNLQVVAVLPETNQLIVKGAVPGRRGTLISVVQA